ncbi:hypothetical protein C8Q74DRAFT_1218430 [Fomes fomentarius]|nr:hypothetical protein C8Q74DRAFT_1218430 [Fomes fomentarius]
MSLALEAQETWRSHMKSVDVAIPDLTLKLAGLFTIADSCAYMKAGWPVREASVKFSVHPVGMKAAFVFLALVASAAARNVDIASPKANEEVKAGENLVVSISPSPSNGTRSTDVAVIIGLQACGKEGNCDAVAKDYGRVLYHGPYNPKQGHGHEGGSHNYTVRIPENTAAGKALLQVAHFFYAGVPNRPKMETLHTVLQITP